MKKIYILLAVIIMFISPVANAATFGFLDALEIGDEGNLKNSVATFDLNGDSNLDFLYGYAAGTIPSNSMITFTYSYEPIGNPRSVAAPMPINSGILTANGGLYMSSGTQGVYVSTADSTLNNSNTFMATNAYGMPLSITNMDLDEMPVQASVDLATKTTIIKNFASAAASFTSYLFNPVTAGHYYTTVHYEVSAVPLPAALPLFGLALVGMAGYSRKKKKAA